VEPALPSSAALLSGDDEDVSAGTLPPSVCAWMPAPHARSTDADEATHRPQLMFDPVPVDAPAQGASDAAARPLSLSAGTARALRYDAALLLALLMPSLPSLFQAVARHLALAAVCRRDFDVDADLEGLERLKLRFGEQHFHDADVVLHDLSVSRRVLARVLSRAREDQATLTRFRSFRSQNNLGSAPAAAAAPLPLLRGSCALEVLLVSHEMWPERWEALDVQSHDAAVRRAVEAQVQRSLEAGAAGEAAAVFERLDAHTHLCAEPDPADIPSQAAAEARLEAEASARAPGSLEVLELSMAPENRTPSMFYDAETAKSAFPPVAKGAPHTVYSAAGVQPRVPLPVFEQLNDYSRAYSLVNTPRTLQYRPAMGSVQLKIEIRGVERVFTVSPVLASVVCCFGEDDTGTHPRITVSQVAALVNISRVAAVSALGYWSVHGVLHRVGEDEYTSTG
jgi:hypothetical protein